MNKWDKPKSVDNLSKIDEYLPAWKEIPEEFRHGRGEAKQWIDKVSDWFFSGITELKVTVKEEVDPHSALRHLKCVLSSFEPKHEHKTAGAAYLMSLWYHSFEYQKVKK